MLQHAVLRGQYPPSKIGKLGTLARLDDITSAPWTLVQITDGQVDLSGLITCETGSSPCPTASNNLVSAEMTNQVPKALQDSQAQRAQLALLELDCARLANPDYHRPFASLEDAVDRLLPYHALLDETSDVLDQREAQAAGGTLAASRRQAWNAKCLTKAVEFQAYVMKLHQALDEAEERQLSKSELPTFMLQSYATSEEQHQVQAAKLRIEQAKEAAKQAQALKAQQAALAAQQAQLNALQAEAAAAYGIKLEQPGGVKQEDDGSARRRAPTAAEAAAAAAAAAAVAQLVYNPAAPLPQPAAPAAATVKQEPQQQAAAQPSQAQQQQRPQAASGGGSHPAAGPAAAAASAQQQAQRAAQQAQQQQQPRPPPAAAAPPRQLTEAERQAEKQKKLQLMAQRIKQRR
ncbi:hypothetical protein N2152v2_000280 [Parachlorella kessleri]